MKNNVYLRKYLAEFFEEWEPFRRKVVEKIKTFLISHFRHVLYVVCFLLGNSPASEFYMPTFRNTLFHLHRLVGDPLPAYEDGTECSETSAYKIQTPGNYPKETIQQITHTLWKLKLHYSVQTKLHYSVQTKLHNSVQTSPSLVLF